MAARPSPCCTSRGKQGGQPLSTISVRSCIASLEASAPLTHSHGAAAVKLRCDQPAMSKVLRGEWRGMDERRGGCISAEVEGSFRGKSRLDLPKFLAMDMAHLTCHLLLRIRGPAERSDTRLQSKCGRRAVRHHYGFCVRC